jgi:ribose transport system permease protein
VVVGTALQRGMPVAIAVLLGLAAGVVAGALNGVMITAGRLPPFIATLGMMSVARGAALLLSDGRPISGFPDSLRLLATGRVFGIPAPMVLMLSLYAIAYFVLTRTVFGRYLYAIGGNEEATALAGVNVRQQKVVTYALSGLSATSWMRSRPW